MTENNNSPADNTAAETSPAESTSPAISNSPAVNTSPASSPARPAPVTKPVSIDLEGRCRQLITDALVQCFRQPGHVNHAAAAGEITSSIVTLVKNEIAKLKAERAA